MIRRIRLVTLFAALAGCFLTGNSVAQTPPFSASWIMVSGSSANGTDVRLQIRASNGTSVLGTGANATLDSLDTAAQVRTALELSWTDGTGSIYLVPNGNPTKIDILDDLDRTFRIYIRPVSAAPDSTAYAEVTLAGVAINGVTYAQVMGVSTGVPTLSEWGFLLLVALMLGSGVWMLRHRNTPGLA